MGGSGTGGSGTGGSRTSGTDDGSAVGRSAGPRTPSELELRNRRARRWGWIAGGLATAVMAIFLLSVVAIAWLLRAWVQTDSGAAYAAEPTVIDVTDGDTVVVRIGRARESVRLLGIDTPETKDPRKPVQCFGHEASEHTAALLPRGTVLRLEHDLEERDAYGRLLAYVWRAADGLFVNLDLVRGGWADVLSIAPNTLHADTLRAARDEARTAGRGLWRACGGPGRPAS